MLSGDVIPSVRLYPLGNFAAAASGTLASSTDNCGSFTAAFIFKGYWDSMCHVPVSVCFSKVWILSNLYRFLVCRIRYSVWIFLGICSCQTIKYSFHSTATFGSVCVWETHTPFWGGHFPGRRRAWALTSGPVKVRLFVRLGQLQQRRLRGNNPKINNNLVTYGGDGFSIPCSEGERTERCFEASHIPRESTTAGHSQAGYEGAGGREMFQFNFSETAEVVTSTREFSYAAWKLEMFDLITDRLSPIATFRGPSPRPILLQFTPGT